MFFRLICHVIVIQFQMILDSIYPDAIKFSDKYQNEIISKMICLFGIKNAILLCD